MKIRIDEKCTLFDMEDEVFHVTAEERTSGMVTGIMIRPGGQVIYNVTWPDRKESQHYACELSLEYTPRYEAGS